MFSTKGPTSPLWKSLAIEFQGKMTLAQARDTQQKVVQEFNVDKFPTLVVLPGGSAEGIVYSGEMKPEPLLKFLALFAPETPVEVPPTKQKSQGSDSKPCSDNTNNSDLYSSEDLESFRVGGKLCQYGRYMLFIPGSG